MPIFEYNCQSCSREFEEIVNNKDTKVKCPFCGSITTERKISLFGVKGAPTGRSCPPTCSGGTCSTCG